MIKGVFLSFEGIDGTGKSLQVKLLGHALQERGLDIFFTKEPGDANMGSNVGAGIRHLLFKEPTTKNLHPGVADLLFLADHVQTAGDVAQAVEAGKVVICDRYADSQFAYAASPTKQCPEWGLRYYREQFGIVPDITVLLVARGPSLNRAGSLHTPDAADFSWALGRAKGRQGGEAGKQDGKAWNDAEEQRKIQNAYIAQIGSEPRTLIVNVWEKDTIEELHDAILTKVLTRFIHLGIEFTNEGRTYGTSSDYRPSL